MTEMTFDSTFLAMWWHWDQHHLLPAVYRQTPHYLKHPSKINNLQNLFIILLQNMCRQQICPSNAINMACTQITWPAFVGEVFKYIYGTYKIALINDVAWTALHRQWWWWWWWWWCHSPITYTELITWPNQSIQKGMLHTVLCEIFYWSFMWKTSVMPYVKPSTNKKLQIWMMEGGQSSFDHVHVESLKNSRWDPGLSCRVVNHLLTMCMLNL